MTAPPVTAAPAGPRRSHRRLVAVLALLVVTALLAGAAVAIRSYLDDDARRDYLGSDGWPVHGQAAYAVDAGPTYLSAGQRPVPIASVAKLMTALVVLRAAPLRTRLTVTVTARDVADTARRRRLDQSVVAVRAGEVLTERQALVALLLPSANNVAIMLARRTAGSVGAFVRRMNATARVLGMVHTTYTDPSGFRASTVSTAGDQVRLAAVAFRDPTIAALVGLRSSPIPVAGVVHNTDTLLGSDGFVGGKTGSMDASGGCFVFLARRRVHGHVVTLTGAVLGQHGHDLVDAGLYAARQLADRVFALARP